MTTPTPQPGTPPTAQPDAIETQSHIDYLEQVEARHNKLREHIAKQYCDTFGLAWLNVPLDMAVELLAKYAKPEWERKEAELMQAKLTADETDWQPPTEGAHDGR